jgi:hypothetical protein
MIRLISHALTVLSLLTIASGCAASPDDRLRAGTSDLHEAVSEACAYQGSMWLGLEPVEVDGVLWLEIRTSAGATRLNPGNSFQADAVILSHDYYRLTPNEAAELAGALASWVKAPHSDVVYHLFGAEGIGITFGGSASVPELSPVVVVNIQVWIQQQRGHVHGGNYVALTAAQASEIALAIEAWGQNPTTQGLIYQTSVQ